MCAERKPQWADAEGGELARSWIWDGWSRGRECGFYSWGSGPPLKKWRKVHGFKRNLEVKLSCQSGEMETGDLNSELTVPGFLNR